MIPFASSFCCVTVQLVPGCKHYNKLAPVHDPPVCKPLVVSASELQMDFDSLHIVLQMNQEHTVFSLVIQGCALAVPGHPWQLTFALGQPGSISYCTKLMCWVPWISRV